MNTDSDTRQEYITTAINKMHVNVVFSGKETSGDTYEIPITSGARHDIEQLINAECLVLLGRLEESLQQIPRSQEVDYALSAINAEKTRYQVGEKS